jgi:uncharacterized protein YcnI
MRCSGWSSRATWVCSGVAATAALALAVPAGAHVSISPKTVAAGAEVDLVFGVPNEEDAAGIVRVTIGIPADFELDDAEAKEGWTQSRTGQAITWAGGRIPQRQFARFAIRGTAPAVSETVLFNVLVGSRGGETTTYRIPIEVKKGATNDVGARTLGKAALIVAVAAAALALGAGFLALYVWLRPPPP